MVMRSKSPAGSSDDSEPKAVVAALVSLASSPRGYRCVIRLTSPAPSSSRVLR